MPRVWWLLFVFSACTNANADANADAYAYADAPTTHPDATIDAATPPTTRLRITNRCPQPIWIAHSDNVADPQNIRLSPGDAHDYAIPDSGLASARFWPKIGCDASGHACTIGDNGEGGGQPCASSGCQPPVDSKFEATFAALGGTASTFYNLSQVDGYTLPFSVTPSGAGAGSGSCVASDCGRLSLDACPANEDMSGGGAYPQYATEDLRIRQAGATIACLSPCKKWNYPAPYGLGQPESQDPGLHLCCPTPPIGPDACRNASDPLSVVHTHYVATVHATCPTAYSYSYDDAAGTHTCPPETHFDVVFCPLP